LSPFKEREGWKTFSVPRSTVARAVNGRVLCILATDALEKAAQSSDLTEPALRRITGAHRQMIELRAAQKLNAGLFDSNGSVLIDADDI
jgi:hypothetical protein